MKKIGFGVSVYGQKLCGNNCGCLKFSLELSCNAESKISFNSLFLKYKIDFITVFWGQEY